MIEQDGFEEESVETQEVAEPVETEQVEDTEQTVDAEDGEVTPPAVDEKPVQTDEENAKYADMRRKSQADNKIETQKAIDQEYSNMYKDSHGITTKAQYDKAIKEQHRQEELEEMSKTMNPDIAKELQENKIFRQSVEAERAEKAKQDKIQQGYDEFSKEYPDVKGDEIPAEVWEAMHEGGKSLTDAYTKYESKQLKERIKTLEHNKSNESKSPVGSVTSHGSKEIAEDDDFMKGFNSY